MAIRDLLFLGAFLAEVSCGLAVGIFVIAEHRRLPPERREGILGTLALLQVVLLVVFVLIYAGFWLLLSG